MTISLVAGLGNPGRDYAKTRHNLGWTVVEALARRHALSWRADPRFDAEIARWDRGAGPPVWLLKPLTFMNECGRAVGAMARYHKLPVDAVAVAYDDLGIEAGRVKVSVTGSAGGHNGVASLLEHLGDGFARYRLGIGPKAPAEMDLKDYVLSNFTAEQLTIIEQKLESYVHGLEELLERGPEQAMNRINRKDPP
jgi:PTH1 family peptidyl-tRNA hydrolase